MAHSLQYHIGESVRAIEVEIVRLLDVVVCLSRHRHIYQAQCVQPKGFGSIYR
ncbi:hypothetical protein HK44_007965 [Pseudomonas fluorescens HK44]|uniref:Uncharacterized protein n=1 Tax=Pseudomonas fluorescens HK44 TaxID=1042209 RepID=A0A010SRE1_PSEFL|nr:hypothetical protein HK44_007965 [Pseudomonas fluorescens HK44]